MSPFRQKPDAILFDLDGTLIESAADLGNAANTLLLQRQQPALPIALYRPQIGSGARGILRIAFPQEDPDSQHFADLCRDFLNIYETHMGQHTKVFDGVNQVLRTLEQQDIRWGIVTNKAERFSIPLVANIPELKNAPVLICGDTTAHSKPHPLPLQTAAKHLQIDRHNTIYVGDDKRDMQAGKSAGMTTVAALYGFISEDEDLNVWPMDHQIQKPLDLLELLQIA